MKAITRRVMLRRRDRISIPQNLSLSSVIKEKLFSTPEFQTAKTIMFYVSYLSEVDTHIMIKDALDSKKICVPVVSGKHMIASMIQSFDDLDRQNEYGILEPSNIQTVEKENIDLIIVPGACFDKENHRVGYGGGYYDRFLKGYKGAKVGICFSTQILETIPKKEWDQRLDKVISEA